jgi:hypothetical protein
MYQPNDLVQVIAQRKIRTPDGGTLVLRMFLPQRFADNMPGHDDCYCPIQIIGDGRDIVVRVAGVDSFQAIELALKAIGSHLEVLNHEEYQGKLEWLEPGAGFGFPKLEDESWLGKTPPRP